MDSRSFVISTTRSLTRSGKDDLLAACGNTVDVRLQTAGDLLVRLRRAKKSFDRVPCWRLL
jgi:hypothetical protein